MQHFFHASLAMFEILAQAAPAPDSAESLLRQLREQAPRGTTMALAFFAGQLLSIISIWFGSMVVAKEESDLGNALRTWLAYLLSYAGLTIAGAILVLIAAFFHLYPILIVLVLLIPLVGLIIAFSIPMKIYRIGFFRALGLLILIAIIEAVINVGAGLALGRHDGGVAVILQKLATLPPAERDKLLEQFKSKKSVALTPLPQLLPGEGIAGDRSKSFAERDSALRVMYAELETRHAEMAKRAESNLAPDPEAIAAYREQRARYEKLLAELKAEAEAAGNTGGS